MLKRPVERSRRRWEDNIKINLKETGGEGADWIHQAQVKASGRLF
jgi:hypothetical protein